MRIVASVRDIPGGIAAAFRQSDGTVHCYDTLADVPPELLSAPVGAKQVELESAYAQKLSVVKQAEYATWLATDPVADSILKKT